MSNEVQFHHRTAVTQKSELIETSNIVECRIQDGKDKMSMNRAAMEIIKTYRNHLSTL